MQALQLCRHCTNASHLAYALHVAGLWFAQIRSKLTVPHLHASFSGLAATSDEWWDAVTDGLADSMADVILAALAATNKLFESAGSTTHAALAMRTNARRTALRVCLVLGPMIDTWRMLPSHAQVCALCRDAAAWKHSPSCALLQGASSSGRHCGRRPEAQPMIFLQGSTPSPQTRCRRCRWHP